MNERNKQLSLLCLTCRPYHVMFVNIRKKEKYYIDKFSAARNYNKIYVKQKRKQYNRGIFLR